MLNGGLENSTPVSPYLDVVSPSLWLPNPRHEQFARLVAAGATGKAAYVGAGYRQRGAASNACSIRKLILQQCKIVGCWKNRELGPCAGSVHVPRTRRGARPRSAGHGVGLKQRCL